MTAPVLSIHATHQESCHNPFPHRPDRPAVSDANRAEAFYGETLGLKKLFRFGELVFVDCAGVRLMLEGRPKSVQPGEGVCHYFLVDGIKFEGAPHSLCQNAGP